MAVSCDVNISGAVLLNTFSRNCLGIVYQKLQASELSNLSFMTGFLPLTTTLFVEQKRG
jgi:hypothetical protein